MKTFKKLIIACDGESASGKSTAAKLISKKYKLLLVNSGLLYRFASKLALTNKPKNLTSFLDKQFKKISYKGIAKHNLHSEQISNHAAILAKDNKIRQIVNKFQKKNY
jgi:cytidylate kinase